MSRIETLMDSLVGIFKEQMITTQHKMYNSKSDKISNVCQYVLAIVSLEFSQSESPGNMFSNFDGLLCELVLRAQSDMQLDPRNNCHAFLIAEAQLIANKEK